jgi:hypothetical protein
MGSLSAPHQLDRRSYADRVLDALPGAAFVIDPVGTILFTTDHAAAIVGRHPQDLVGESVLTFVDSESAWAYASAVAMATDYPATYTGPLRIKLVDAHGDPRHADLWAHNRLDDPDIGGIVCLLTEETAAVGLAEAIAALAGGDPLDEVISLTIRATFGHPVVAHTAAVLRTGTGVRWLAGADVAASSGLPGSADVAPGDEPAGPWSGVLDAGVRRLFPDLDSLPPELATLARMNGYAALWIEPVIGPSGPAGPAPAALVLWRGRPGNPSPNQLNSIHQAAGIVGLAITLDASRS